MHAGASAASWTCGDSVAIADAEATSKVVAKAVAEAVSLAYPDCSTDEGGYICESVTFSASFWVEAAVRAWAGAWARAVTCPDKCTVSVDVVVEAVGHILVDAATDAYVGLCRGVPPVLVILFLQTAFPHSSIWIVWMATCHAWFVWRLGY
jgi:hypothetical protein